MDADRAVPVAQDKDAQAAAKAQIIAALLKAQSQQGRNVGFDPTGLMRPDTRMPQIYGVRS